MGYFSKSTNSLTNLKAPEGPDTVISKEQRERDGEGVVVGIGRKDRKSTLASLFGLDASSSWEGPSPLYF